MIRRGISFLVDPIDRFLDKITSYRLVLYFLTFLFTASIVFALSGRLPYEWYEILFSGALLVAACWGTGYLLARFFNVPRNSESDYISAFILVLILSPAQSGKDAVILVAAAVVAMASKYLVVIGRRHIFNPAAFGAAVAGWVFSYHASWWVGTAALTPFVILGGLLILRKMKRFTMVGLFLAIYILVLAVKYFSPNSDSQFADLLWLSIESTPLLFFSVVMLTEPLTSPQDRNKYIPYAVLVGILYSVIDFRLAPEEALLIGNVLAYLLAHDPRHSLTFVKKRKEAAGIYSYIFKPDKPVRFRAGQFLEWTLPVNKTDTRGNRRYLTISSSPTENNLMLSVKIPQKPSSFKKALEEFKPGDRLLASHLAGTFTLPKNSSRKLAFLAGGIGITPFRSMAKNMLDKKDRRNTVLLYSAAHLDEFAFVELFNKTEIWGLKTSYVLSDIKEKLPSWDGYVGFIDAKLIKRAIPDYKERIFYVSGPYSFVQAVHQALLELGVKPRDIKLDYFPGYG